MMLSLDSMFEKLQTGEKIHDAPGQNDLPSQVTRDLLLQYTDNSDFAVEMNH